MERLLKLSICCSAAVAVVFVSGAALPQRYPDKPVRVVVPSAPGGSSDTITRIVAQKLSGTLGQSIVVDNRAGAAGNIGADIVAKTPPDGYTLLVPFGGHAINATLYRKLPYDLVKDFDPVILMVTVTGMLVVHPSLPVKSVKELIALAKARPGQIDFATPGIGNVVHLAGELFKIMVGVNIVPVPYRGSGPALAALLGGEVPVMFPNMPGTIGHVQAGRLRVLAVNSGQRSPLLPDVPTLAEAGVPGYEASTWFGVLAPSGTPKDIISKLNTEIARVLKAPEMVQALDREGAVAVGGSPEQFGAFIKAEIEKWGKVVQATGVRAD